MDKYKQSIINRAKKIVDDTPKREFLDKYYPTDGVEILIRDDAKDFTSDWVNQMDEFIGERGIVVDKVGGELDVECRPGDAYYSYFFSYKSVIPIELLDSLSDTSNMYSPRKFIYESNIERLNEIFIFSDNDDVKQRIKNLGIEPEPIVWIGDVVKLKKDSLKYYEDENWCEENEIGYDSEAASIIEYCIENDVSLEAIGKFKGGEEPKYPWWTLFKNDQMDDIFNSKIYIPDPFIQIGRTPSYSPRKFIYESKSGEKYYNPITKEKTDYPFRFKTKEEFKKEYGDNWRSNVPRSFPEYMDILLGIDFSSLSTMHENEIKRINDLDDNYNLDGHTHSNHISKSMITPNDIVRPMYAPKQFVYEENQHLTYFNEIEKKPTSFEYRFKTEEEFEEEFGEDWADEVNLSWAPGDMDYLFGINIQEKLDKGAEVLFSIDGWNISKDMITKNKLMSPTYKPRKLVYEDIDIEDLKYNTLIEEAITEFTNDYNIEVKDNIDDFIQYYRDIFEKVNPKLQDMFKENIKKQDYNVLIINKDKYNLKDKMELMILLDSIGIKNLKLIREWIAAADDQSFLILLDNFEMEESIALNKKYVYKTATEWTQDGSLVRYYNMAIPTPPMRIQKTIEFINKIIKNPITMYKPKQFVYENLKQYNDRISELDINSIVLDRSVCDEKLQNDLVEMLEKLQISNAEIITKMVEPRPNKLFLIVLNNCDNSSLGKNYVYSSSKDFIVNGDINRGYNEIKQSKIMSLQEAINFVKTKILYNASSMYEPRKFIYESKLTNEHNEKYLENLKKIDYNAFIFNAKDNTDELELIKLKEILKDLHFAFVIDSFNSSQNPGNQMVLIILHNAEGRIGVGHNSADKGRLYTCDKQYIDDGKLDASFPQLKYNGIMRVKDIIKAFDNLTGIGIPSYQPRKFIYEHANTSLEQYRNNMEKSGFNCLLMNQSIYDREKVSILCKMLDEIGISSSPLNEWNRVDNDYGHLITMNNWDDNRIDKNRIYQNVNVFYLTVDFTRDYPDTKATPIMNLDEIISFLNKKIFFNPRNLYQPKKFVYESNKYYPYRFKTEEEMEEEFGPEWWDDAFGETGWNNDMDHLLGTLYPYQEDEVNHGGDLPRPDRLPDGSTYWEICWKMLTKNEKKQPTYQPKKFVYESNIYYPYRFKTEEEMVEEFGEYWHTGTEFDSGWNDDMDEFLGKDYPFQENEVKHDHHQPRLQRFHDSRGNGWSIDWKMLTKNKPKLPTYQPKKFVYETKEWTPYRFKTRKEFEEEYGESWQHQIGREPDGYDLSWISSMNYLLGTNFDHEFSEDEEYFEIPRQDRIGDFDTFSITRPMIIKNKPKTPNYNPRKLIYESNKLYPYRFKTRKEMEKEFGENWEHTQDFNECGWNIFMNKLLGQDYPFEESELKNGGGWTGLPSINTDNCEWTIDMSMLTKNKPTTPTYEPKKFVYENIKKLKEF